MHSFAPVRHMFLNVVMFVPYGFLFAMMDPEELTFVSRVLPAGLFMSTMIESVQMLLNRGQADVDDIIANTLGAVIGMIGFRIFESFSDLREN
ncbi:MAG: VanZ family protein, partial [Blautia sp.]|nr:VanZ family protein [Blautia sp.]